MGLGAWEGWAFVCVWCVWGKKNPRNEGSCHVKTAACIQHECHMQHSPMQLLRTASLPAVAPAVLA